MNCVQCNSDKLVAAITVKAELPMAARSGSVKIGGQKITHLDFKEEWDKQAPLRGPIFCSDCGEEHYFVVGGGLKQGSIAQARQEQP